MKVLTNRTKPLAESTVIEGESANLFEALLGELVAEHQPETDIEMMLVESLAVRNWRRMRLRTLEAGETGAAAEFLRRVGAQSERCAARTLQTFQSERASRTLFLR